MINHKAILLLIDYTLSISPPLSMGAGPSSAMVSCRVLLHIYLRTSSNCLSTLSILHQKCSAFPPTFGVELQGFEALENWIGRVVFTPLPPSPPGQHELSGRLVTLTRAGVRAGLNFPLDASRLRVCTWTGRKLCSITWGCGVHAGCPMHMVDISRGQVHHWRRRWSHYPVDCVRTWPDEFGRYNEL